MKRFKSGFTVLEVIVVVIFVGILAAGAIYMLNVTRASNRDSKRVSDVAVIRASLTQYWLQKASYPTSATPIDLGKPGVGANMLTLDGFVSDDSSGAQVLLTAIPQAPNAGEYYRYHGSANGYSLRFKTERATAYGFAGTWYAHTGGVDTDDSEK